MKQLLLLLLVGFSQFASAQPLLSEGSVQVTSDDVLRSINEHVPEAQRAALLRDPKRMRDFVAQVFAARRLAAEFDSVDPTELEAWRIDNAVERLKAKIHLERLMQKVSETTLEQAARETYLANPGLLVDPEQVSIEHVLIGLDKRDKDAAQKRAEEVLALARAGERSFADLALEYSDDQSVKDNKGNLGFFKRGTMVGPFEDAAFAMKTPGELAGPVETQFGFHVLRFVDRKPEVRRTFEEAKSELVRQERLKAQRSVTAREYERIGKLPGIVVDAAALEAFVQNPDAASAGSAATGSK